MATMSQWGCASWVTNIRSLSSELLDCIDYNLTQTLLFDSPSQTSSNNFKIINTSIDYLLSSKRFGEPLFYINDLISKSEFRKQFYFLYIIIISFILFIYVSLLVIIYSQFLQSFFVSDNLVILFLFVFFLSMFYMK